MVSLHWVPRGASGLPVSSLSALGTLTRGRNGRPESSFSSVSRTRTCPTAQLRVWACWLVLDRSESLTVVGYKFSWSTLTGSTTVCSDGDRAASVIKYRFLAMAEGEPTAWVGPMHPAPCTRIDVVRWMWVRQWLSVKCAAIETNDGGLEKRLRAGAFLFPPLGHRSRCRQSHRCPCHAWCSEKRCVAQPHGSPD